MALAMAGDELWYAGTGVTRGHRACTGTLYIEPRRERCRRVVV
jgi:hypothetical protein